MRGSASVTFSDIYMVNMENDVVVPSKPTFYCRFVDEIYSRQKVGNSDFFDRLNNYHPKIKFTIKVNPRKSLGAKLTNINGAYKFNVYWKNTKLRSPWTSRNLKRYKYNTINDLHQSKRISPHFDEEIPLIKEKFMKADYPLRFINSVVKKNVWMKVS